MQRKCWDEADLFFVDRQRHSFQTSQPIRAVNRQERAFHCLIHRNEWLSVLSQTSTNERGEDESPIGKKRKRTNDDDDCCTSPSFVCSRCQLSEGNVSAHCCCCSWNLDDMYAEICAYLTSHHYFELPTDRVRPLFSFFSSFLIVHFPETIDQSHCSALVFHCHWNVFNRSSFDASKVGDTRDRSVWFDIDCSRRREQEEDESDKHLSEETISTATALLAKTPANGIIHSTRSPLAAIRHRVRFQSLEEQSSPSTELT